MMETRNTMVIIAVNGNVTLPDSDSPEDGEADSGAGDISCK